MDTELILDAAGDEVPGLRELARQFLEAEAGRLGVPLDAASVLARRAGGVPEVHITAAAGELLEHLAAEPDALMALARAGAQAMVTRAETGGAALQVRPHC